MSNSRPIVRATVIVMVGFLLAKIAGMVRQLLVARAFGATDVTDAYQAAFTAPDLIFMLISGGALATAFIPILAEYVTGGEGDNTAAWRLASNVLTVSLVVALIAASVAALFAPTLVAFVAPDFAPDKQALTVDLMRLILISTIIFSLSGLVTGILHTLQHFLTPAFAPLAYNLGIIFGAVVLAPSMGVYGLAWGSILGAALHLAIQIPPLLKAKVRYIPIFNLRDPGLRQVALLMAPRAVALTLIYSKFVIRTRLASGLGEGAVSTLDYAWDLMQLPETLFATAVATAVFPTLAELSGQDARQKLADMYNQALRAIITLTLPAAVGVGFLALPIVRAYYERGAFTYEASVSTSIALQFFAFGIVGHGILEIITRLYYARKDTTRPLLAALVMLIVTAAVAWGTVGVLGVGGIALADTIGVFVEAALLLVWLRRYLPETLSNPTVNATLKVAGASGVMAFALMGWLAFAGAMNVYLVASGGIVIGGLTYGVTALLLGVEEVKSVPRMVLRRV